MPLKLDAEKEGAELAKKYKVSGFPTILFLTADGTVMGSIGGYMPPASFAEEMTKNISLNKERPAILAALKKNPSDPEANAKMTMISAAAGDMDKALKSLALAEKGKYKGAAMAKAYNAVGDHYQLGQQLDNAIDYFNKADKAATNANDRSYALVSLMYCYLGKEDEANAKKTAQRLISLKGANPEYVKMAKQVAGG